MRKGTNTNRTPSARTQAPQRAATAASAPVAGGGEERKRNCAAIGLSTSSSAGSMKRVRHEPLTGRSDVILSGSVLRNKTDAQLLPSLFDCHRILRATNPPFSVDATFIEELLSPRYLKSTLAGVQQITGCLLSDLVRLSNEHTQKTTTSTLPFDTRHVDDVLACLAAPFEQVISDNIPLKSCEHIIERASVSRVFLHVLPHCRQPVEHHISSIFKSIHLAAGTNATAEASAGSGGNMIASITVIEMARILIDILNVTNTITTEQIYPLLKEVTAVSPTLLSHAEANRGSSTSSTKTSRQEKRGPGAMIAARVLLEQLDVIQPAIASHTMELVQHGIDEVKTAEITESVDDAEGKRRGLRDVGRAMECFVALVELNVQLVGHLVPLLLPCLEHDHADIRLLLLRGFFLAFGAHEDAVTVYRVAFNALISHFTDQKHAIRMEMLQLSVHFIRSNAHFSNTFAQERAREMLLHIEQRLLDHHALVRRCAVLAYVDIVTLFGPSFVASLRMEKTLGLRIADKNPKVRQVAIEQLAGIYQRWLFPWIPDAVMCCLNAEGGAMLLDSVFELMLPPPSRITITDVSPMNSTLSTLNGRRSGRASMALFDFEKENEVRELTYADGMAKLCAHLSPLNFSRLLTFAAKKAQLRLTILRLFELRAKVRGTDLKSLEGQEMINSIQRLLNFLQAMTHTERGEWDTLFRSKDDKISKAFLTCCRTEGSLHYMAERELLLKTLKGRVEGFVLKFVQDSMSKQMMLPLEMEHIDQLLARLRETLGSVCNNSVEVVINTELQCEVEGIIRALLTCGYSAPSFLPRCVLSIVDFLGLLCQSSNANGIPISWVLLLLRCLTEWANYVSKRDEHQKEGGEDRSTAAMVARKGILFKMLEKLSTCGYKSLLRNATPKMVGAGSKQATRSFLALLCVRELHDSAALKQLVDILHSNICKKGKTLTKPDTIGWLKALTSLAKCHVSAPLIQDDSLAGGVADLLHTAICDNMEEQDSARANTKEAAVTEEVLPLSNASAVVDAAAKCLTAIALSYADNRAAGIVASAIDSLLDAFKIVSTRDARSVGSCRCRLSISQQLCKLVMNRSSNIGKDLAVAVILSAEGDMVVRCSVQLKLFHHLTQRDCDMRYGALLFLSAIGEEKKKGYQRLRNLVIRLGDHLRKKQLTSGVTLSSPSAVGCFLEYCIPFLVFFMAHHPFYSSEEVNHFVAYQRVFHLLFDELFRQDTQCAGFVVELFYRIKQSDDVLDKNDKGIATRVLCDLGYRVLQECMGKRQVSVAALKRYPGRVFLPNVFVPIGSSTEMLNVVYLDSKVHIFTHVPFRAPVIAAEPMETTTAAGEKRKEEELPATVGLSEDGNSSTSVLENLGDEEAVSSTVPENSLPSLVRE